MCSVTRRVVVPLLVAALAGCEPAATTDTGGDVLLLSPNAYLASTAPCSDCEYFTGALADEDDDELQPSGGSYETAERGTHRAWLSGPEDADYVLELQGWDEDDDRWETVAKADGSDGSDESLSYEAGPGRYRWRVASRDGSGAYTLWMQRPLGTSSEPESSTDPSTDSSTDPSTAPCTDCTAFSGSVGVPPSYTLMPPIGYGAYMTDVGGTHTAWLSGTSGAELTMLFQQFDYQKLEWITLAESRVKESSTGQISRDAPAGRYRFHISAKDEGGTFDFWMQTPIPPQTPPSPDPAPCEGWCEMLSGFVSSYGQSVQPSGGEYTAPYGVHEGWLRGPSGSQFVLELMRWDGFSWNPVAVSDVLGSDEHIIYVGPEGRYRWRVVAVSNGGDYLLWMARP